MCWSVFSFCRKSNDCCSQTENSVFGVWKPISPTVFEALMRDLSSSKERFIPCVCLFVSWFGRKIMEKLWNTFPWHSVGKWVPGKNIRYQIKWGVIREFFPLSLALLDVCFLFFWLSLLIMQNLIKTCPQTLWRIETWVSLAERVKNCSALLSLWTIKYFQLEMMMLLNEDKADLSKTAIK